MRLTSLLDLLYRRRQVSVAIALAVATLAHLAATSLYSWHFVTAGSKALWSSDGLHLYALSPDLQMGPLTFAVGGLFSVFLPGPLGATAAIIAMLAVGFIAICTTVRRIPMASARHQRGWMGAAILTAFVWTEVAVHYAHLDDVLALGAGVLAIASARNGRLVAAAICIGVAIDFKPWTLPLVALLCVDRRRLARGAMLVAAVVLGAWLPFFLADPATANILGFVIPIAPTSSLRVFGVHATTTPAWDRVVQLGGASALVLLAVLRRRWEAVLLLLVAFRMLLDPAAYLYYDSGLVLGTLFFDTGRAARASRAVLPITTIVAVIGITANDYLLAAPVAGLFRTGALVAILAIALVTTASRNSVAAQGCQSRSTNGRRESQPASEGGPALGAIGSALLFGVSAPEDRGVVAQGSPV